MQKKTIALYFFLILAISPVFSQDEYGFTKVYLNDGKYFLLPDSFEFNMEATRAFLERRKYASSEIAKYYINTRLGIAIVFISKRMSEEEKEADVISKESGIETYFKQAFSDYTMPTPRIITLNGRKTMFVRMSNNLKGEIATETLIYLFQEDDSYFMTMYMTTSHNFNQYLRMFMDIQNSFQ